MSLPVAWKQEYESLTGFVGEHPEIVITPSEISIPRDLREEFYLRFDRARMAVVEHYYPMLSVDVETLCTRYVAIEKDVMELLGLEEITMPADLSSFLHRPKEGLTRVIYNRLFDLLQQKIGLDRFEENCALELDSAAAELFRLGYEWWAALALIRLLEPDESYGVDLDDDYKPVAVELKSISFGRQAHHPTIRLPEFVLHSGRLNRYVAVKMALASEAESFANAVKPPVRPKKRTGDTSFVLDSRVMLLSFIEDLKHIPIVAEIFDCTLSRPDWIVECLTKGEALDPDAVNAVKQRAAMLQPKMGVCAIVMDDAPVAELQKIFEGVRPFPVGLELSRLHPVVDALAPAWV